MAKAGVQDHVGRKSGVVYDETLYGVQFGNAKYHQFDCDIDPSRVIGDPNPGLLPLHRLSPEVPW